MEKNKSILLKLTDEQFKELAHAKVESGEKSWEAFVLRQNTLQMTAKEYAVVIGGLTTMIAGFEGVDEYEAQVTAIRTVVVALQSRYEGHPTTVVAETVRRALAKELSGNLLKEDDPQ